MMGVSRGGYYKWRSRGKSTRAINREKLLETVASVHGSHRTHGYRWVAAFIRINRHISVCDNMVYKCFRYLGLCAQTKHKQKHVPRKIRDAYPNLIFSTWDCVDRPRQVIVSDMTALKIRWLYVEVTFYFDVFTKEMLAQRCGERRGDRISTSMVWRKSRNTLRDKRTRYTCTLIKVACTVRWPITSLSRRR